MKIRKTNILQKLSVWFFCLAILTQGGIKAPVLCFESDGHVNIEAKCDASCKVPSIIDNTHQDDCNDCIDISFWNYNPDLAFTINSNNLINTDFEFIQPIIFVETFSEIQLNFHPIETYLSNFSKLIKTTILLV